VREARDWLGVAAPNVARKGGGQSGSRRGPYGALSSASCSGGFKSLWRSNEERHIRTRG